MSALKQKGIYTLDPESANGYSIGAAFCILIPFAVLQFLGWADFLSSIPMVVGCGLISAVIWWLFARVMTAKTLKGARTHIAVLGFQEFMNRVDADRLKTMPPNTFEKFLPYAMALGVEHHWAQAFAGIIKDPPTWYAAPARYGYGMVLQPDLFSSSMHGMATDMHQVFVSAPRASSGGSGFGWRRIRWRRRILWRRVRRRWRQRVLINWCARRDSNSQPSAPKADALSD